MNENLLQLSSQLGSKYCLSFQIRYEFNALNGPAFEDPFVVKRADEWHID